MSKKNKSYDDEWYGDEWDNRDEEASDWKRSKIREKRRNKYKQRDDFFEDNEFARGY